MSTAAPQAPQATHEFVQVDQTLVKATIDSVQKALVMCDVKARCVGISSMPAQETGSVTGIIGVHGKVSGFFQLNLSERFAIRAVQGLLQESFDGLTSQVVDGAGEITNIVVGGIKGAIANSPYAFSHITVPSVIVGSGYQIAFARGLEFVNVTFEHDDPEAILISDRLIHASLSLLRL